MAAARVVTLSEQLATAAVRIAELEQQLERALWAPQTAAAVHPRSPAVSHARKSMHHALYGVSRFIGVR